MKNLLLFEQYVTSIYEVDLSDKHYSGRTSLDNINSRIIPYSPNNKSGFEVKGFVDSKQTLHNTNEIIDILGIDQEIMNNYISNILYFLTNSKKLKDFDSPREYFYKMLNLGRICFKYFNERYYPLIAGGMGTKGEGFYDSGDRIWAFIKDKNKAITLKYYRGDFYGEKIMINHSYKDAKKDRPLITKEEFFKSSEIEHPYGLRFEALVDLTNYDPIDDESEILEMIRRKIEGS